ncbi:hypothetical protein [Mesorhizobium sp. BR1-1-2]|uniref:hypothetical protein n=1 Tax=Mesorhizobium sp. BR1-1-2 TaxID=2876652 RepID=UPI001CCA50DC|nr:hypothetical protein [Mesorhizobium sp. BR1-1-2]MBZ9965608.1 hypothetical protein [Mesorhizobium sp. BR1-1-2]
MNDRRLPWRYKALIAASLAIVIAGILLRPIYPKSIFIAMFVMSVMLMALSVKMVLGALKEPFTSRHDKSMFLIIALMALGASAYGIFLTLHSVLR